MKAMEWYNLLPQPYRTEAIENFADCWANKDKNEYIDCDTIFHALTHGFYWHESKEGNDYWESLYRGIKNGTITLCEPIVEDEDEPIITEDDSDVEEVKDVMGKLIEEKLEPLKKEIKKLKVLNKKLLKVLEKIANGK